MGFGLRRENAHQECLAEEASFRMRLTQGLMSCSTSAHRLTLPEQNLRLKCQVDLELYLFKSCPNFGCFGSLGLHC